MLLPSKKALILLPFPMVFAILVFVGRFQVLAEQQPAESDELLLAEESKQEQVSTDPVLGIEADAESIAASPVTEILVDLLPEERLTKALQALRERIAKDRKALHHPAAGADEDYSAFREDMLLALEEDPSLLSELMDLFAQDIDSHLSREISAVLSEIGTPEVQAMALDIGLNGYHYDHAERTAALFIVANMDAVTGDTRDRLLDSLIAEQDTELLQFSMLALKPAPSTRADYARVQETLNSVITNENAHVRRHAASQIGRWATSNEDLEPLRVMAVQEQDMSARARAILFVGKSPYKSEDNKAVLWTAVTNEQEWPPVRQAAWELLQGYPLSDSEISSYEEVGGKIEQAYAALFSDSEE